MNKLHLQDEWKDKYTMLGSFIGAMARKNGSTGKPTTIDLRRLSAGDELVIPTNSVRDTSTQEYK